MLKAMNKVGVAGPVGVLDTIYVPAQGEAAGVA